MFYSQGDFTVGFTLKQQPFYIDTEDLDKIKNILWRYRDDNIENSYIQGSINGEAYYLHRYIMGVKEKNIQVDHKNGCKYDCRKSNLRIANNSENGCNKDVSEYVGKSGYIGISIMKNGRYRARIKKNRKEYCNYFDTLEEAIQWRRQKEIELHGEFNYTDSRGIKE